MNTLKRNSEKASATVASTTMLAKSRRQLAILAVAATLALTAALGHTALGSALGADWTPTIHACESQGSGSGGC